MILMIFDTETTGLPRNNPSIYTTQLWPHILQLSYILYDSKNNHTITEQDIIIKLPENVHVPPESTKIHGITKEKSNSQGINIKDALKKFFTDLETADLIIGHNLSFDKRMVIVECIRGRLQGRFPKDEDKYFCTMKKSVDLCKIEATNKTTGEKYYKYPTLSELYYKLFNSQPQGVHNALIDVRVCLSCYLEMNSD